LERIWKEAVPYQHVHEGTEEYHGKSFIMIVNGPAETRTRHPVQHISKASPLVPTGV
jgi:hypothetical protein